MSTRIKYSCPKCNHTLSDYSKKGYPSLHTGIGLEYITCDNCFFNISSGLKPWSEMNSSKKIKELLKTGLNILIISSIFGGFFLGGGLFLYLKTGPFTTSSESGRVNNLIFWFVIGTLILSLYKIIPYIRYHRWVEKQKQNERNTIPVNEFRQKYHAIS